ncbi:MAG: cell division protein FtsL [Treponemataceae bacterium]|nr:cell division protein FtsL [Treponemataceae bacterium]
MKKVNRIKKNFILCMLAFLVPLLLVMGLFQVHRFKVLQAEVDELDEKQYSVIDGNRRLVGEVSLLAGADRIEETAVEEYGMKESESEDIIRIKVGSK